MLGLMGIGNRGDLTFPKEHILLMDDFGMALLLNNLMHNQIIRE